MATSRLICVRNFSSSAVCHAALVKPPIAVFGVEGRYATALYSAAVKSKKLEAVEAEMKRLKELVQKDVKLAEFISNPLVNVNVKKDAIGKALTTQKYSPITINLLGTMADNGRLKKLNSVFKSFNVIMSALRGEVICEIISAKPIDEAQLKELEKTLKGFVKKEEKIFLETKVDPSLIGGLVVSVGDKYVDMSFATKIKTYSALLKETI